MLAILSIFIDNFFCRSALFLGGPKLEIKHKIWLEKNGRVVFGQGRDNLLKAIEECKSLNAAAKKLNMSYRAAWGRLKASEERLGIKLVERSSGEALRLTAEAKAFIEEFDRLERSIDTYLGVAGDRLKALHKSAGKPVTQQ